MRIIIGLDIIDGKCVRLTRGDFSTKKVYNTDPLDVAKLVEDSGLKYLHLVDLEGAGGSKAINFRTLEKIASGTSLRLDFGGGLRTFADVRTAFDSGAAQVTCSSISVTDRSLFLQLLETWGSEKIILGADCLDRKVVTHGWTRSLMIDIKKFIDNYASEGIRYVICTDVEKDGTLAGPSTGLYREILVNGGIRLIASGGVSTVKDIEELSNINCDGVIVGKALYEGLISLNDLERLC